MTSVLDRILSTRPATPGSSARKSAPIGEGYTPNPEMRENDEVVAPSFPLEALPPRIRRIIEDCYNYLSYPRDFTAAGILAATSIAIARTHRVKYQWDETGTVYMALVAPPGTAKSHPLKFALEPVIQANKKAIRDYNKAQKMLADTGQPTTGLRDNQCLFSDFTIEALVRACSSNPRGIAVYLDELRAWFQNFNRYNSGSEQEFWLQNWSNTPLAVTRLTRKTFLDHPSISVVGTIQPSLLEDIGKGGRAQNGFVERMLFCYPDSVPVIPLKKRHERSDTYHIIQKNYHPIMQTILDKHMLVHGIEDEDDQPHEVWLAPEADDLLTDFLNYLKEEMQGLENEYLRNVYSKMQTYTIRFCLLIHILDWACESQSNADFPPDSTLLITSQQVERACWLTEYFLNHAMKTHNAVNGATPIAKLPKNYRQWYNELPNGRTFTTNEAEAIAPKHQISRATMFRLLNEPNQDKRIFLKIRNGGGNTPGEYEKIYY